MVDIDGRPLAVGCERQTTNIRMEATALGAAMKLADGKPCQIHTDSQFWINVLTQWAKGWAANNWTKKKGEIKNLDLVQELYQLYNDSKAVLIWVRGHNDHPQNEAADRWANAARQGMTLEQAQATFDQEEADK